ncbi:MAG TPA: hypothetical protein VGJ72_19845 [Polaromonas sp.]
MLLKRLERQSLAGPQQRELTVQMFHHLDALVAQRMARAGASKKHIFRLQPFKGGR